MSLYLGEKLISGIGQDRIADTLPIGAIIEWDSDLIPENWLLLNGQAVSRTVYSELFAIYGTTYGAGDGSTTFNLPDRRTRVAVGRDVNDEDFAALGITGGEKEHTLSINEMPSHNHAMARQQWYGADEVYSEGTIYSWKSGTGGLTSPHYYNPAGREILPEGGSQPHNNLQPYIVTNFIVKAKLYTTEFIGGNMVIDNLTSDSSVNVLSARMGKELDAKKFDKGEVLDYVIETGTDGIWTYRKYNSGIAECWGRTPQYTVDVTSTWGNIFTADDAIPKIDFPFTFKEIPVVSITPEMADGNYWFFTGNYGVTTTATPSYGVCRGTSRTGNIVQAQLRVIGRWK